MIKNDSKNVLLLGLPETGKTSFLAAFYHTVSAEIPNKTLFEYKLSRDSSYLNQILHKWLKCEKLDRTSTEMTSTSREVVIHLEDRHFTQRIDLDIPDLAGETFETQFVDRIWDSEYKEQASQASGLLLFISPAKVRAHALIDDIPTEIKSYVFNSGNKVETVEFDVENLPTQVVLVDILLSHLENNKSGILNLAVVISAWDEIINSQQNVSPAKWLEVNLPLLYQYLITNFEQITFKIFGISAQGGVINDPKTIQSLQAYSEPADRIIVREDNDLHKNICAPIEWIIKQWQNSIK